MTFETLKRSVWGFGLCLLACWLAPPVHGQDFWQTVEFSQRQAAVPDTYKAAESFNVKLPPIFTADAEGWTLSKGWRVDPRGGHNGQPAAIYENNAVTQAESAVRTVPLKAGYWYTVSAWVKLQPQANTTVKPQLLLAYKGSLVGSVVAPKKRSPALPVGEWAQIEMTVRVPRNTTLVRLHLKLDGAFTGQVAFSDIQVHALQGKWNATIFRPYRRAISSDDGRILANSYIDGPLVWPVTPVGALECAVTATRDGTTLGQYIAPIRNDRIAVDLGHLPPGELNIQFSLLDPVNKVILATDQTTLTVMDSAAWKNRIEPIDPYGRMIVDGKPFFPIGVFTSTLEYNGAERGVLKHEDIEHLAAAGFNTVMDYAVLNQKLEGSSATGPELVREILDAYYSHGIRVIFCIKDIGFGYGWDKKGWLKRFGDDSDAVVEYIIQTFKDHPAIIGWYTSDEDGPSYIAALRRRSDMIHKLDPNRPTMIVEYLFDDLPKYANAADVLGIDPYPIWGHESNNQDGVKHALDMAARTQETSLGQPLWGVPQSCNLSVYQTKKREELLKMGRLPTEQEMRSFGLLMVIEGAKALTYYAYNDLCRDITKPDFAQDWPKLTAQAALFRELSPAILNPQAGPKLLLATKTGELAAKSFVFPDGRPVIMIAAVGPGKSECIITVDSDLELVSRYGKTTRLSARRYRFTGENIDSDLLTAK